MNHAARLNLDVVKFAVQNWTVYIVSNARSAEFIAKHLTYLKEQSRKLLLALPKYLLVIQPRMFLHVVCKQVLPSINYLLLSKELYIDHIQSIYPRNVELATPIDPKRFEYLLSSQSKGLLFVPLPLDPEHSYRGCKYRRNGKKAGNPKSRGVAHFIHHP